MTSAPPSPSPVLRLHPEDNVAVARSAVTKGTKLGPLIAEQDVPAGHKIAVAAIAAGDPIRKFGQIIGFAEHSIRAGEHIHLHNCALKDFKRDPAPTRDYRPTEMVPEGERATFEGIVRPDGRVATRNYIGVLTTVNCSATVAKAIADRFRGGALVDYPNVDGVVAFTHAEGCGIGGKGETIETLRRTLAGYLEHPNLAGVLLLGLGCEANQGKQLLESAGLRESPLLHELTIQGAGGSRRAFEQGLERVASMLAQANAVERTTVSASHLSLALQCGGSDGYSGITANPALGAAADLLVRHGGTAILSETPEIYGAEQLLTRRACNAAVAEQLLERIAWWEAYTAANGGEMNNNPTPGNKAGGLTTILEKSLGAVAKGGTSGLMGVYKYAERIDKTGFVFMDSPGYDPCSITGQVASGANLVCFTTGRGSVYGCKPVPSLKLATNSALYERMREDMDINCGDILDGIVTVQEMGALIFQRLLEVASGSRTKSEELGFGDNEFVPWHIGAVM